MNSPLLWNKDIQVWVVQQNQNIDQSKSAHL